MQYSSDSTALWPRTRVTKILGIDHPIVQGPFGGGLSSVALASTVSNAGGLGSFGAQPLDAAAIGAIVAELRAATSRSFAVNLWVSTSDLPTGDVDRVAFDAAVAHLQPLYDEFGVTAPTWQPAVAVDFESQVAALIEARPPAFSFVFGVPDERILAACREAGIVTMGTAITVDEAVALDQAGVDIIVASGFEAGGHRVAFLDEAEDSLVGTIALIPAVVDEVRAPVIAAGGISDRRGIAAAFALGAEGVQIGTAFLATDESNAPAPHKALLREPGRQHTRLTRAYSGRLARGIPNRAMDVVERDRSAIAPYPLQQYLMAPLRAAGGTDASSLWAGQATSQVSYSHAAEFFAELAGLDGTR